MYIALIIIISVLLTLCLVYLIYETIKRKQRKKNQDILESHWHIGIPYGSLFFSLPFFVLGIYYSFIGNTQRGIGQILWIYALFLVMLFVAFFLARKKVILTKSDNKCVAVNYFSIKRFNVVDVTLIKENVFQCWKVYVGKKKQYQYALMNHESRGNVERYIFEQSNCEVKDWRGNELDWGWDAEKTKKSKKHKKSSK